MSILLGVLVGINGLFATLWYRTLVGLPASRKPRYVFYPLFKWGVPLGAVSLLLFSCYVIGNKSITTLIVFVVASAVSAACVLRFDRYSAEMRLIYDRYRNIGGVAVSCVEPGSALGIGVRQGCRGVDGPDDDSRKRGQPAFGLVPLPPTQGAGGQDRRLCAGVSATKRDSE
jgi:hypothetical protein